MRGFIHQEEVTPSRYTVCLFFAREEAVNGIPKISVGFTILAKALDAAQPAIPVRLLATSSFFWVHGIPVEAAVAPGTTSLSKREAELTFRPFFYLIITGADILDPR